MSVAQRVRLFEPDLFSDVRKPRFEEIDPRRAEPVFPVLETCYGIPRARVESIRSVPNCLNSELWLIRTGPKRLFLKKRQAASFGFIEDLLRELRTLRSAGGDAFPELHPAVNGGYSVVRDDSVYYLMQDADPDAQYAAGGEAGLGEAVGRAVTALKTLRVKGLNSRRYFTDAEQKKFSDLKQAASDGRLSPRVEPYWESFRRHYETVLEECKKSGWLRDADETCHIDLHPHNLLVEDSRLVRVLDLESIQRAHRPACLGFFVFKALRNQAVLKGSRNDTARLRGSLVEGLLRSKALDASETGLLSLGARVENLKRFLAGFLNVDPLEGGPRLPIFGKALAGEIDAVFSET